jgi:hypothetical protein
MNMSVTALRNLLFITVVALCFSGCAKDEDPQSPEGPDVDAGAPVPMDPNRGVMTHQFPPLDLEGFEETLPCITWNLNNDEAIYVEAVTLYNEGASHHSNWFVVPEALYEGPDGFFRCRDRGFDELNSALAGTVIFAQSTQSREETQRLPEGVVIKIPPRHRVVAGTHFLNLSSRDMTTSLRLSLEAVHPRAVETVVAPFRLGYFDLHIPAGRQSRMTGECLMSEPYTLATNTPFDMKLYYVLPHYHALGNYFRLEIMGGPRDGEVIMEMDGFNAEANGQTFDPPIDLTGAEGLRLTCGFNNPRDEEVGWGIGDQEMCEFLGLADTRMMMDGGVQSHSTDNVNDTADYIEFVSPCTVVSAPKNEAQTPPTEDEIAADLYLPDPSDTDRDVVPIEGCVDTPADAVAEEPVTFEGIRADIFHASCNYNACHGGAVPAAGLDLTMDSLREALIERPVVGAPDRRLVVPGNPDESWLYQVLSRCEPSLESGGTAHTHMPLNAPVLLEPGLVARVRDWIANGAE